MRLMLTTCRKNSVSRCEHIHVQYKRLAFQVNHLEAYVSLSPLGSRCQDGIKCGEDLSEEETTMMGKI